MFGWMVDFQRSSYFVIRNCTLPIVSQLLGTNNQQEFQSCPISGNLQTQRSIELVFLEHAYLNVQSCSTLSSIFLFFKNQNILHPSEFLNISCLIDTCAKVYKCTWLNIQMYLVKYTNVPG